MNLTEATIKALKENEEELVSIPRSLISKVYDSLYDMSSYMDNDGSISRSDPDFSDYFETLDTGVALADELYKYLQ